MKISLYGFALAAALVAVSVPAFAEQYSGQVSSVNFGDATVRILRNDTHDYLSVRVKDRNQLNSLKRGADVTFDAKETTGGQLETNAIKSVSESTQTGAATNISTSDAAPTR